jgi:DNA mismatch repair protein MutL
LGRIRVLPDHMINRIAAGEVVERPASVLKELVENSIDSGALSIEIQLKGGGKRLIRVIDDGSGMDRDDALLALERHATSKLSDPRDLEAIATLGFRGEAISSIAAVSIFVLRTALENGAGSEIEAKGGKIIGVQEAGLPRGTSIDVERLFFNVPARRKFLRTDGTELSHCVKLVTHCALSHPGIRFRLRHDDRQLLNLKACERRLERISELYGRSFIDKLLPFERSAPGVSVSGFAGRPADALPRRDKQHFFVNGRIVQDRMLSHAVAAAYGNTMPRGRYPAVFLFVELEPDLVDVNVHPQKSEVRFRHASALHDVVQGALSAALSHEAVVPDFTDLRPATTTPYASAVSQAVSSFLRTAEPAAADRTAGWRGAPAVADRPSSEILDQRATPVAQYRDSYIIAQDERGLVIVDQHAAHERVLFERYLREAERNDVEVQKLLFPVTVELAAHEYLLVENEAEELRRLGFLLEPFGGKTVRLDGVPAIASEVDPESLLRELLGEATRARSAASDVDALRRRLITTAACQAAIKVNHTLNRESMQGLLDDLFATVSPSTCPHGRPLLFRLSLAELERAFDRR